MAKARWAVVGVLSAAVWLAAEAPAAAVDEVFLRGGERVHGELDDGALTLQTPQGAYKVGRQRAWRLVLGQGTTGDSVELRNGNRLSGRLDASRYTLRVAGGQARVFGRAEVIWIKLGPPAAPGTGQITDVLILKNGDSVYGQVTPSDLALALPTGTQRYGRDAVWAVRLNSATGDTLQFLNGGQLSGIVEQPRYEVRTPDGQTVAFGRDEVRSIVFQPPPRPRAAAAAPAPGALAATPPPAAAPPPAAPAPVPPAVRAVLRDLQFEFDRWELTPEGRRTLEELATAMKAYPELRITVEGHADERGTSEYNLALGSRRAQSARDYLINLGIAAERLETTSYGEERPVDPAHNEMAWALNRRAHFVVKAP
jgi:peptidoglycan-associated lipoprotein